MLSLGQEVPNFDAKTTNGRINFHKYIEGSWCILFSHPRDFTPVCTTELGRAAELFNEFKRRDCKILAVSCDTLKSHYEWIEDIKEYINLDKSEQFPFAIIEDVDAEVASKFHMMDFTAQTPTEITITARACFMIGPDKCLKASILYPSTTGRNFDEILRVIDSLQLCSKHKVATGVDWKLGKNVFIEPYVTDKEAEQLFPKGFKSTKLSSGRTYLRETEQP